MWTIINNNLSLWRKMKMIYENLKQLPGETQEHFEKRVESIRLLGDKWLLAKPVEKLPTERYA